MMHCENPKPTGDIDDLMARARSFDSILVYQTVGQLEDSYDFEGMTEVGNRFIAMCQRVNEELKPVFGKEMLHLGKGGCGLCKRCTILDNEPCRMPDKALSSLEMYGVDVYRTTEGTGLKYINGPETVTYFGMVLFND